MTTEAYLMPQTVEQCLKALADYQGKAQIMAGGTDLILALKEKKIDSKVIVDITDISELKVLEISKDTLTIGAGVTHAQVAAHPQIKKVFPALTGACVSVGSPQIRNIATLVGNIVSAQPAADSAIALIALGARVEIVSNLGQRVELVENLYAGIGKSKIDSHRELVTKIVIDLPGQGGGCAFTRIAPREALALPIVNAAAFIMTKNKEITLARIALGPVSAQPFRPQKAEAELVGKKVDDFAVFVEVAHMASMEANPRDSLLRGSGEYRRALVRDLVNRAITEAINNAVGG